ncbi:hypothetical protein [Acaryochloris sp. CCMEE 5410]|uniref:hypothetical protein n=1 Tax=Acaryochloris sp. CCMEE 5410 TaxID=310037 RepID=UPI0021D0FA98|nr:hypothetical protein [Acaryochloris sp. CCMEE 5410]KAI9133140.1 hypothetical protein ON05_007290 [Acaryochloris sp. CCMEE 5410]
MFGDARSAQAQAWFRRWRHQLRHGQHLLVLRSLTMLIHSQLFTGKSFTTLLQVQAYFQRHLRHIQYRHFEQLQIPLGSGMVESACKWLIQQRFKGLVCAGVRMVSIIYSCCGLPGSINGLTPYSQG